MPDIEINCISISEYTILFIEECEASRFVANRLDFWIKQNTGNSLKSRPYSDAKSDYRIIIGTPLPNAKYGDGCLYYENNSVFICGNDVAGLTSCASYLVSLLKSARNGKVNLKDISYSSSLQARDEYLNDAAAFLPVYRFAHSIPDDLLTLEEKAKVLNNPCDRPFVIAHRCEHSYYPENSLEGAISAWRCGADAAEMDIQKTSDGIFVCMHDKDITRVTNANEFMGKPDFPSSPLLSDWSFDQLRSLRLKDSFGQTTPFLIPTLKEMLKACDKRIYAHIDKSFSVTDELFPIMDELGIYNCVYFITNVTFDDILAHKDFFADKGVRLDSLPRPSKNQSSDELAKRIIEALPETTPAIIPVGDYVRHSENELELVSNYGYRLRVGAWFLRDFDTEKLWITAKSEGISIFMTNHPMELIYLLTDKKSCDIIDQR